MNDRTYPILEEYDEYYAELEKRNFDYHQTPINQLVPLGVGNMVAFDELEELRKLVIEHARSYGFREMPPNSKRVSDLDKEIGKLIYNKMDITPSIAATIPMWNFINLCLLPDYIAWRFGDSKNKKEHFISDRRNYFGTQWWRYYLFCILFPGEDEYMKMSDRNVADLYERSNSCGLPGHIVEQYTWFCNLMRLHINEAVRIRNRDSLFRECLKQYGAKLSFRCYFSLTEEMRYQLFEKAFTESVSIVQKRQDEEDLKPKKVTIKLKMKTNT